MLPQAEISMWAKHILVESFAPLHDRPWVAFYTRYGLCLHDECCKDCVVVDHDCPAPTEALDDFNACFLCCFCVDELILLPAEAKLLLHA